MLSSKAGHHEQSSSGSAQAASKTASSKLMTPTARRAGGLKEPGHRRTWEDQQALVRTRSQLELPQSLSFSPQ